MSEKIVVSGISSFTTETKRFTKVRNALITDTSFSKILLKASAIFSITVPLNASLTAAPIFPNERTTRPAILVINLKNGEKALTSPFATRTTNLIIAKMPPRISRMACNVPSPSLNVSDIFTNLLINSVILSAESSPNTSVHASLNASKIGNSSFKMFLMPCSILSRPEGSLKLAISLSNFSICAAVSSIFFFCSSVISLSVSSAFPRSSTAIVPF